MQNRKSIYLTTIVTSLIVIMTFAAIHFITLSRDRSRETITVGFVYDGDESTPYTANFIRAQKAVERKLGDKVHVIVKSNVHDTDGGDQAVSELIAEGCDLIFTTSSGYGVAAKKYAGQYPSVQFCQATCLDANSAPVYENYHTFMGEVYEGRYISGVIAGMKLQEMIDEKMITENEAKVGYVAAYPYAEVISGYTAFFLGVRAACPSAVMDVKYTYTWSSYHIEKACADELINRGCVVLSQHSDTTGPAIACEEMYSKKSVYHVGYNSSMIDVAPTSSLVSLRINWEPYILGACEAVLANRKIEDYVEGHVHGNDIGGGFDLGWVEMLELNTIIAPKGAEEKMNELIRDFSKGKVKVFEGEYIGVDPNDPERVFDLRNGYSENREHSAPTFHYVLRDVITVVE